MKLYPQGPLFGLTAKRLRVVGWTTLASSVLCVVSYGIARDVLAMEYRRAGSFLEELKGIQPGQSEVSVMPFILRYHGVRFEEVTGLKDDLYIVRIDPWHLMHPLPGPSWGDRVYRPTYSELGNWRRVVKLRSWTVSGWVKFSNGKVDSVSGDAILEGENEWLLAEWQYGSEIPACRRPVSSSVGEQPKYQAHWTHLHFGDGTGEGIVTSATPRSTTEELNAARNINLSCLMAGSGCRSLCDLMPDATRYRREHDGGDWGWNSGDWGRQPHSCE